MACSSGPLPPVSHVRHDLHDARDFLGRSANTAKSSRTFRPKPNVDSPRVLVCGLPDAILYNTAGSVRALPDCTLDLLGEHSGPRGHAVLQLGVRYWSRVREGRYATPHFDRYQAPDFDWARPLRLRRFTMRHKHVLEYRLHRASATQLCYRPAFSQAPWCMNTCRGAAKPDPA